MVYAICRQRISRTITKYTKCNFSDTTMKENSFINLENHELPQKGYFKYLSPMLNTDGDIDEDVKHRIAI